MKDSDRKNIEDIEEWLRTYGSRTVHNLTSALLIWLFGNLVFIPLANSLNWQTVVFCTLTFFFAFTILMSRALPDLKKLIDAFSIPLARKCGSRKQLGREDSLILFRHTLYIASIIVLYLLYYPFLANFHPAINGIVLIMAIIWILLLALGILPILYRKILEWLYT